MLQRLPGFRQQIRHLDLIRQADRRGLQSINGIAQKLKRVIRCGASYFGIG
jgi:hypothetical protein